MTDQSPDKKKDETQIQKKKEYLPPEVTSEKLLGFGAVCNGTTNGGRKDTTGAPNFCNATRLMS